MIGHWTVNQRDGGSIPPIAVSKLRQFHSPHICLCLLTLKTLKVGGPFYPLTTVTYKENLKHMPGQFQPHHKSNTDNNAEIPSQPC